jgi:hypothetical protein
MASRLKVKYLITGILIVFIMPLRAEIGNPMTWFKNNAFKCDPMTWFKNNAFKCDPRVSIIAPHGLPYHNNTDMRFMEFWVKRGPVERIFLRPLCLRIKDARSLKKERIVLDSTRWPLDEEMIWINDTDSIREGFDFSTKMMCERSVQTKLESAYFVGTVAALTTVSVALYKYYTVIRNEAQELYKKVSHQENKSDIIVPQKLSSRQKMAMFAKTLISGTVATPIIVAVIACMRDGFPPPRPATQWPICVNAIPLEALSPQQQAIAHQHHLLDQARILRKRNKRILIRRNI